MTRWQPERAIAAGRSLQNMTQADLAQRLTAVMGEEWTRGMVAALESGRKTFDVHTLQAVSKIQGLPVSFYLGGISVDPGERQLDDVNPIQARVNALSDEDYALKVFGMLPRAKDLEPAEVTRIHTPNLFERYVELKLEAV